MKKKQFDPFRAARAAVAKFKMKAHKRVNDYLWRVVNVFANLRKKEFALGVFLAARCYGRMMDENTDLIISMAKDKGYDSDLISEMEQDRKEFQDPLDKKAKDLLDVFGPERETARLWFRDREDILRIIGSYDFVVDHYKQKFKKDESKA